MRGGVATALLGLGLVFGAGSLGAQGVELGVRGGMGWTTVAWSEAPDGGVFDELERRSALTGGIWVGIELAGPLRLRGEALLGQKGFREVDGSETTLLDVDYIEIPVLLGLQLPTDSDAWSPELYLGGYMAFERSCEVALESPELDADFACDDVPEDPVLRETTDWGAVAGVTVSFDLTGPVRGLIDARYTRGFRNIDGSPEAENLDISHRGLQLSAGLGIRLGS